MLLNQVNDPHFHVELLRCTPNPQQAVWMAMHQCYSEGDAYSGNIPDETEAGELVVKHLLQGNKGHYGPLEHPQIMFNVIGYPHSVMQQYRTHRIGVTMDVQSGRYSGERIKKLGEFLSQTPDWLNTPIAIQRTEDVFYLRPLGYYTARQGDRYEYTQGTRRRHLHWCMQAAVQYWIDTCENGLSKEHARSLIPFDFRQNFALSVNLRSLMHLLDMRGPKDAQLEAQHLAKALLIEFVKWAPQVAEWHEKTRWQKSRLAP
jgi:thymidylate synthase (FAD)